MKKCRKCGQKIEYGINGCSMLNDCFRCNGGYPRYSSGKKHMLVNWDEADAMEDRVLANSESVL